MSASKPTAVLTSAAPSHEFSAGIGTGKAIATSGPTGAGVIRIQQKVRPGDAWVDNPNTVFATSKHLSQILVVTAPYNRITVTGADGTTDVAVYI